jgi:O-acetyl-ADP-ribose deacetylase (regulator of RNase III)
MPNPTTIIYLKGDATRPAPSPSPQIIAHICNDIGGWGAGFVLALSRRWRQPESAYRAWHANPPSDLPFELGQLQLVQVEPTLYVANMIAQHDITRLGQTADNLPPIRYDAVGQALSRLAAHAQQLNASIHMPRIGCGLAGGTWDRIEPLIHSALTSQGIPVTVYDFP